MRCLTVNCIKTISTEPRPDSESLLQVLVVKKKPSVRYCFHKERKLDAAQNVPVKMICYKGKADGTNLLSYLREGCIKKLDLNKQEQQVFLCGIFTPFILKIFNFFKKKIFRDFWELAQHWAKSCVFFAKKNYREIGSQSWPVSASFVNFPILHCSSCSKLHWFTKIYLKRRI